MPRPKYAIAGEINFHNVSDERLKSFIDMIQSLIFEYDRIDPENTSVLRKVWKDLAVEQTRRLAEKPLVEPSATPPVLLKKRGVKKAKSLK